MSITKMPHTSFSFRVNQVPMAIVLLLLTIVLPTSCRKEYINGDLEGMWRVDRIKLADGTETVPSPAVYYSFEFHVVQLSRYDAMVAWGNLAYDGSTIKMDFPYNTEGSKLNTLAQWGIYTPDVTFKVEKIDGKTLVMSSPASTVTCTKF